MKQPCQTTFQVLPDCNTPGRLIRTFTFLLSAVVSSNTSPSLKEISVFFRELSVLMLTLSPWALIVILGFSNAARCRNAAGTPGRQRRQHTVLGRANNRFGKQFRKDRTPSSLSKFWTMCGHFFSALGDSWKEPDPPNQNETSHVEKLKSLVETQCFI